MTNINKTIWKVILAAVVLTGGLLMGTTTVCAQSTSGLEVVFENKPLFENANVMPGYSVARWVEVTNTSGDIQPIITEAIEFSPTEDPLFFESKIKDVPSDDLSRALTITISIEGGDDLYGGTTGEKTLFQFYHDGETYLSAVANGATEKYIYKIAFPADKANEWQGKTTNFTISVGFMGKDGGPTCNYNNKQDNGETGIDCGGGGCPACSSGGDDNGDDNGGGGGGGPITRGLTIRDAIEIIVNDDCSVTATWITNYFSTSQMIYGAEHEAHDLDMSDTGGTPPAYGYAHTTPEYDVDPKVTVHTVTIAGLTSNTTYYYRCVSHASPPTISKQYTFATQDCGYEEEPPVEEPPAEEPPAEEPDGGPAWTEPDTEPTGGITGGTEPVDEEPVDEEPVDEEPTEEEPEANFTAGLAGIFSNLFKDWGDGFPCLPWWLLLVLIIYSLVKGRKAWKRKNQEQIEAMRTYWKKAAIVWFDWGFLLLALLLIFYFFLHLCFTLLIFLILALLTGLIQYALARAYRKRRDNL